MIFNAFGVALAKLALNGQRLVGNSCKRVSISAGHGGLGLDGGQDNRQAGPWFVAGLPLLPLRRRSRRVHGELRTSSQWANAFRGLSSTKVGPTRRRLDRLPQPGRVAEPLGARWG